MAWGGAQALPAYARSLRADPRHHAAAGRQRPLLHHPTLAGPHRDPRPALGQVQLSLSLHPPNAEQTPYLCCCADIAALFAYLEYEGGLRKDNLPKNSKFTRESPRRPAAPPPPSASGARQPQP